MCYLIVRMQCPYIDNKCFVRNVFIKTCVSSVFMRCSMVRKYVCCILAVESVHVAVAADKVL